MNCTMKTPNLIIKKSIKIDYSRLKEITENYHKRFYENTLKNSRSSKRILNNILENTTPDGIYTETYVRFRPYGRMTAVDALGIQALRKELRFQLLGDNYLELDTINSTPNIISQYCDKLNIQCPTLKDYVNNREERLAFISNEYNITREQAKKKIIYIIYGEQLIDDSDKSKNEGRDWLIRLNKELLAIIDKSYEIENEEREYQLTLDKPHKKSTVLFNIIFGIENDILQAMDTYLKTIGTEIKILIYDGGFVEKIHEKLIRDNMSNIIEYVKQSTGYAINLDLSELT